MVEPKAVKYRAFISYSHQDTTWAKWLQRGLEGFKIDKDLAGRETARGTIPESLRPTFRDREDFTAGEALPAQTHAALDASNALVVVCSPDSAKSNYVNEEIRSFKSRHPDRPIIPLIVGGKPDDPTQECFAPALRHKFDAKGRTTKRKAELLAADAREQGDGNDLALAKVIAGLLGLSSDDVFRRAERERRAVARRRRRVQALVGVLGFAILAGVIGWMNQDYLLERWRWFTTIRPYMMSEFRPHVLSAEVEQALRPKDTFRECAKDCPELVVVPVGTFTMGSPKQNSVREEPICSTQSCEETVSYERERPQHNVTIAKPFAVSKFEVTFDDWDACVAYGDCPHANDSGWGRGDQPAINVSWGDAQLYVAWLSKMTGKTYRLVSEAEWEYAARGGTRTEYSWGDELEPNDHRANCYGCGNRGDPNQSVGVGHYDANAYGLYDMAGNVSEWVEDCFHNNYEGAPDDGSPWVADGECSLRTLRGGSWKFDSDSLRSWSRQWLTSNERMHDLGFRVARTLDQ
jgi:formylglycine-generating enzyme required for sulfatase activity